MNRTIIQIILLTFVCKSAFSDAIICGKISNYQSPEIVLMYNGGSFSMPAKYYLPDDLYQTVNDSGEFKFVFKTSKYYCCYTLAISNAGCNVYIKDNDSLYITFEPNEIEKSFAAFGNDNGMTNFMFAYDRFLRTWPKENYTNEVVISFFNDQHTDFLKLLESFRRGRLHQYPERISRNNRNEIDKLITATKLTQDDYEILSNYSNIYIYGDIWFTSENYQLSKFQFSHIDDFLAMFRNVDFKDHFVFYDGWMENLTDDYVQFSCYKKYMETHDSVNIKDANAYLSYNKYAEAKELLSGEILEKYLCDRLYELLLDGEYSRFEQLYTQCKSSLTHDLYRNTVEEFYTICLNAMINKEYSLNLPKHYLNDTSLPSLLDSLKGQKVYLVLWKIDRATTVYLTPLSKLHELNNLELSMRSENTRFIDICLGDESRRQQWASLIIQYKWSGEHYFISKQYEDEFRKLFNCQNRMKSCGSELYLLINENGQVLLDNNSNILSKQDLVNL